MELLAHLLTADPARPRFTVYDEHTQSRLDFSAQTLDNWAAKVGNMLYEELDLAPGSQINISLPCGWQSCVIALGAITAGVDYAFGDATDAEVEFCTIDRVPDNPVGDLVVVTDDPFGRGVVETGGTLPPGTVDFGPTVRFYGEQFLSPTPRLADLAARSDLPAEARVLSTGWIDTPGFHRTVLEPLAVGGSAVVVSGMVAEERLGTIAEMEKTTLRL
ncbi:MULTISPECIES: TIGR03089 family protein [unclassified Corynebacterium]|uniref:TIGR03089 family protein n=1 Tax=unclassified Corynebacterium TaxID=2624378 RepID=UPI0029C9BD53|nr:MULTISPECIES: TIGR03089 family protein [unclassified Corynebacterium]WPF66627.1 TIGR03089 family protein [Corynebacterium sp. 22KM0430]WPF69115.1 TIGR03089 family protein [Corynebacterium sp. 21KM1197]